jgi:dinuclear metal center YbgI/SA1388 family protein
MTHRQQLQTARVVSLQPERFKDYCPNGLQVEDTAKVHKIVSGVTANLALIDVAITQNADTIFVHLGLFGCGCDGRVTGWMRQCLGRLLEHNIKLFAYHLPLEALPELGNDAQLGVKLGLQTSGRFGEQQLGCKADTEFTSVRALVKRAESVLGRAVVLVTGKGGPICRVAWCTSGAQNYFEAAIAARVDATITEEISEPQANLAREMGVAYFASGRHATECYGALAVAAHIANQLDLERGFIDIDNPA